MMQSIVLACFIVISTADQWPNLKTTFGLNPFGNAFESQPRTQEEAISYGYSPISEDNACAGKHLGFAYGDPNEPSLVLLFDEAGYIAGVQSVFLDSAADSAFSDHHHAAYTEGTFFEEKAWFTTAYFVDPAYICAGGRTEDQWNSQGTGDRLWIQVGETPDNFVKIPLTQAEADGAENWHKHWCFLGMGTHYMEFNYEIDQDCNEVLPVQILYDQGVITGFVWQHNAYLTGARLRHPCCQFSLDGNTHAVNMIIDRAPQCALDMAVTPGLSTLHHYFYSYPWLTLCL
jgi:hypothetical protein